jgi:hypothetical protein
MHNMFATTKTYRILLESEVELGVEFCDNVSTYKWECKQPYINLLVIGISRPD